MSSFGLTPNVSHSLLGLLGIFSPPAGHTLPNLSGAKSFDDEVRSHNCVKYSDRHRCVLIKNKQTNEKKNGKKTTIIFNVCLFALQKANGSVIL